MATGKPHAALSILGSKTNSGWSIRPMDVELTDPAIVLCSSLHPRYLSGTLTKHANEALRKSPSLEVQQSRSNVVEMSCDRRGQRSP